MGKRRQRPLTPELRRRIKIRRELEDLDIRAADLAKQSGKDPSLFTRFFWNDIGESEVEAVIMRTLRAARKKAKAHKSEPILYV